MQNHFNSLGDLPGVFVLPDDLLGLAHGEHSIKVSSDHSQLLFEFGSLLDGVDHRPSDNWDEILVFSSSILLEMP